MARSVQAARKDTATPNHYSLQRSWTEKHLSINKTLTLRFNSRKAHRVSPRSAKNSNMRLQWARPKDVSGLWPGPVSSESSKKTYIVHHPHEKLTHVWYFLCILTFFSCNIYVAICACLLTCLWLDKKKSYNGKC